MAKVRTANANPFLRTVAATLLLTAAGCTSLTRSNYSAPELAVDPAWEQQAGGVTVVRDGHWWDQFGNPELSELVDRVLAENADLAAAGIRLRQARLSADLAASQLLPTFSGSLANGASGSLDGSGRNESSSASLGVSWEIDLFGRLDAERDARRWEAEATAQDLAATSLSLAGTTTSTWFQLAYANERISIAEDSLAYSRKVLDVVQLQYNAGAVSRLELRDAEQTVASQEASLTQLIGARAQAQHALAALLGQQTYDGPELTAVPDIELPELDAGVPAELLGRRPDLAAAELRLRSQLASSDATVASFYPQWSLTGALGTASNALLQFLATPTASLGAALSLPFLNPERVRLQSGIAKADYELAVTQFRQTFYDALRDTGDALSAREQYARQAEALQRNYEAARDSEQLYQRQYRAGAVALRSWLDAQERLRNAHSSLIENRLNQLNAQVALYQALGGDATIPG